MKKFVMVVLVLIMVCSCAFASVASDVSECLEVDYDFLGSNSLIKEMFETEMPCDTATGVQFSDKGYYLEYKTGNSYSYGWVSDVDFYDATLQLSAILGALYANGDIDAGFYILLGDEVKTIVVSAYDLGEDSYTDVADFLVAIRDTAYEVF